MVKIRPGVTDYVKLFKSDWCPLSGQLPSTGSLDSNEQTDRSNDVIRKARQLWSIEPSHEYTPQELDTAQAIARTYPQVKKDIESTPIEIKIDTDIYGDPTATTLDLDSEGAINLVRKYVNPRLNEHIKDHHILAILAIAEAWGVLKNILYHKRGLNDQGVMKQVQVAGNLVAQAEAMSLEKDISDLKPKAEYADEHLLKGCVFRKKMGGEYWDIVYDEKSIHPKNSKGLEYIHYLLSNPEREIYVLQIVGVDENLSKGLSKNTGTLLDNRTTEQLKGRYKDLEEELEDKEIPKSDGIIAEIEEEMEKIKKAFTSGLDKRGQPRKFANVADRARKAVSKAIKESLVKIKDKKEGNPALWNHFDNTLHTGTYCSYKPEHPMNWQL